MPRKAPVRTRVIGTIQDVQLPAKFSPARIGTQPVSLQLRVDGAAGSSFEWFAVHKSERKRVYELASNGLLPFGQTFAFLVDECGAIVEFTIVAG